MRTILKGKGSNFVVDDAPTFDYPEKKKKTQTISFNNPPYVAGRAAVVGKKEGKGPIANIFT